MKNIVLLFVGMFILALLSSCAGPNTLVDVADPQGYIAGFWSGLFHGFIAPFSFLLSLFIDDISIYAVHNNGGWYDFGFLLGIGGFAGGATSSSK